MPFLTLASTGWPFRLWQASCWHQNKSSDLVWGPCTKTQLLFWCQQDICHNLYGHPVYHISYQSFLSLARLFWQNTPVKSCAAANWAAWLSHILLCMLVPKSLFVTLHKPQILWQEMIWIPHLIFFINKVICNVFGPDVKPVRTLLNWDGQLWVRVVSGSIHFWGHHGKT